jgi:hypothetical protein
VAVTTEPTPPLLDAPGLLVEFVGGPLDGTVRHLRRLPAKLLEQPGGHYEQAAEAVYIYRWKAT